MKISGLKIAPNQRREDQALRSGGIVNSQSAVPRRYICVWPMVILKQGTLGVPSMP